ncbi:MAG: hydrogenase expression protein HypE [Rhodospirillales bacterium CG15_BIG_FIL_POST_REV_8_21_14_020_66_15]|nr:MAG: hydrogenase expression protein HypE [Rhodospirillales bacterium CG15_BIG_FIL_POST_REV_8_21_14_020_66_15]
MSQLEAFLAAGRRVQHHRPWPRAVVDPAAWVKGVEGLADGRWTLVNLWAQADRVHMALYEAAAAKAGVVSLDCIDGGFPSVGRGHPPAIRLERAIQDLFGLCADGLHDTRPWLDHGLWGQRRPLAGGGDPAPAQDYGFLPCEGEGLHQVAVGPVHAGIIEPGHFRFTANGETVVRLEERLGYLHKGIDRLMAGAGLERGAQLAGRTSGDSTVAYAWAFAQAAEAALGVQVPERALWLRAVMAELERLANHLGDIGAVCNDAAFAIIHAHTAVLRERVLRAADACFGHRLMRDRIVPGGVSCDLDAAGETRLRNLIGGLRVAMPGIIHLFDDTPSLKDRTVSTGRLTPKLAARFGAGGFVGRASGRDFDTRRDIAYAPYDGLAFEVPVVRSGDVNARVWIRIQEVEQGLSLLEQCLAHLRPGPLRAEVTPVGAPTEGLGMVEGFRGDVFAWLALDAEGRVDRCHLRDPSWFQWPLLEAVIEDNIIADFPLCNKSFNCSYSGHDL